MISAVFASARSVAGAVLLAVGAGALAAPPPAARSAMPKMAAAPAAMAAGAAAQSGGSTPPGLAVDSALLSEYERRLFPPAPCQAERGCAQLQKASLSANGARLVLKLEIHALSRTSLPMPALAGAQWEASAAVGARFARGPAGLVLLLEPGVNLVEMGISPQADELVLSFPQPPKLFERVASGWTVEAAEQGAVGSARVSKIKGKSEGNPVPAAGQDPAEAQFEAPLFVDARRQLRFDATGAEITSVYRRLSPASRPASALIDLLPGERVLAEGLLDAAGKRVKIDFKAGEQEVSVASRWDYKGSLTLKADPAAERRETWIVDAWSNAPLRFEGLSPISRGGNGASSVFMPKPGESLTIVAQMLTPAPGAPIAIDRLSVSQATGEERLEHALSFFARSTIAAPLEFSVPEDWKVMEASVNRRRAALSRKGAKYVVDLSPGGNEVQVKFKQERRGALWSASPSVSIDAPAANLRWMLEVPPNQWVLLVGGPLLGPAVLLWGVLLAMGALAYALSRSVREPFAPSFAGWLAVLVPISALSPWSALALVAFVCALAAKRRFMGSIQPRRWNGVQLGLMLLGLISAAILLSGVYQGLLGSPDMMVVGNGSSASSLSWYQDKAEMAGPTSGAVSAWAVLAPMWAWRAGMLLWALWIASAVAKRLPAIWAVLNAGGLWRKSAALQAPAQRTDEGSGSEEAPEVDAQAAPKV